MICNSKNLRGVITALVTPFNQDCRLIDFESLSKLIDFQLKNDVAGLLACGSTGEANLLSEDEYREVVKFVKKNIPEEKMFICGVSAQSTQKAVEIAEYLNDISVDGILLSIPPYVRPSQSGILRHVECVYKKSKAPIILYDIPSRTSVNILPETIKRLTKDGMIVGIKEASTSIENLIELTSIGMENCSLLAGDDSIVYTVLTMGGNGVISASANLIPDYFNKICKSYFANDIRSSLECQLKILPIIKTLFLETNPAPVKEALFQKKILRTSSVRLPLVAVSDSTRERISKIMEEYQL